MISLQEREKGAIFGQFVGDAAALGAHWYYDLNKLSQAYPQGIHGFENPHPDHYHKARKSGEFTHYGDAALVMLASVAEQKGFSDIDFGTNFLKTFCAPDYPGYLDKCTKETIKNYRQLQQEHPDMLLDEFQQGANDDQVCTLTRLAPVIVVYYNKDNLLAIVERATKVTQDNPLTIAYAQIHAAVTAKILQGKDIKEAFEEEVIHQHSDSPQLNHVRSKIQMAMDAIEDTVIHATGSFGQSCHLDSAFPSAVHSAIKHRHSFKDAILETICAGGDSAGRAAIIGTWLGAYLGENGIPNEWKSTVRNLSFINSEIAKIIKT